MRLDLKKLKKLILFFLSVLVVCLCPAHAILPSGSLQGRVIDALTGEPLEGVSVLITGQNILMKTDSRGFYRIHDIPQGKYSIEFTLAGYKTSRKSDIIIALDGATRLDVELEETIPRLKEEVTVTAEALSQTRQNSGSVATLTSEEAAVTPATVRDISRILKILPGISHIDEKANDLIVRGGSPTENGFYVDNIPIPNVNHFQSQGNSGGAIGLLNLFLVKDLNFYTGGFGASYGNRMSSIVDITFKEGIREKTNTHLYLHLSGFGSYMEGPLLKKKGSWIFSLNRNYHDLILSLTKYAGLAPRFGDVHFKLVYPIDSRNKITLLNIFGSSRLSFDLEKAIEFGKNREVFFNTNQNTLGVNWFSNWSRWGYSSTSLSYSFLGYSYESNAVNPESATTAFKIMEETNGIWNLRNVNVIQFNDRSQIEFGIDVTPERFKYDNRVAEHVNNWEVMVPEFSRQGRIASTNSGVFLSFLHSPMSDVRLSLGMRADHFSFNKRFLLSPRLSASWQMSPRIAAKGAVGIYGQALPMYLLTGDTSHLGDRIPRASHYILGLKIDLDEKTSFNIDIYQKRYKNLPITPDDPSNFVMDSGVDLGLYRAYNLLYDTGIASSRGIEFYLHRKFVDRYYGVLTATIFRSRFKDFTGAWRSRLNDNQYILIFLGGYEPNDKWIITTRLNIVGGRPFTPFDLELSTFYNQAILDRDKLFSERLPAYMTLNVRLDRRFSFEKSTLHVYLGVMNLLNRKNVAYYYWNKIENHIQEVRQGPILPEFGFEYRF